MRRVLPIVLISAVLAADEGAAPEYTVKAAFLGHFGRFVTWPDNAFPDEEAPFRIGVLGKDPFGSVLDAVAEKPVQGRRVELVRLRSAKEGRACHVVFVAKSEKKRIASVLKELEKSLALTVGETEGFAKAGGVIGFVLEGGRVRFQVNPAAARRSDLVLHPKLLKLGHIVEEDEE